MDPECLRAHIAGALDAMPDESLADAGAAHPGGYRERAEPGPAGREVAPSLEPNVRVERDRPADSPPCSATRTSASSNRGRTSMSSARYASRIQSEPDPRYGSRAGAYKAAISLNSRARAGLIEIGWSAREGSGRGDVRTPLSGSHVPKPSIASHQADTHEHGAHRCDPGGETERRSTPRESVVGRRETRDRRGDRRGHSRPGCDGRTDPRVEALQRNRIRMVACPAVSERSRHEREREGDENAAMAVRRAIGRIR